MKKYAFIIDIAKCENCNNCFLACKDEHCGNDWPGYTGSQPLHGHRWMHIKQRERGTFPLIDVAYLPKPCMHCDEAPCVEASGGFITKRADGIVLIGEGAKGHKEILSSCPHGSLWWNEELNIVQKCTMCAHLLDSGWKVPRCVQACPTGALTFFDGTEEELRELAVAEELEVLVEKAEVAGSPCCYYKNLYRYNTNFVAGSLAWMVDGVEECASGIAVVLQLGGQKVSETASDDFGDFRFDGLHGSAQDYQVAITVGDGKVLTKSFILDGSINLGVITLT